MMSQSTFQPTSSRNPFVDDKNCEFIINRVMKENEDTLFTAVPESYKMTYRDVVTWIQNNITEDRLNEECIFGGVTKQFGFISMESMAQSINTRHSWFVLKGKIVEKRVKPPSVQYMTRAALPVVVNIKKNEDCYKPPPTMTNIIYKPPTVMDD